jgi:ADP-ribose pyrophosphatase YjhB (NUDIX family)
MYPKWLEWAQRLQSIAQSGLSYNLPQFDIERYQAVQQIAAEIMAQHSDASTDELRALFAGEKGHTTPKVDVRGVVFRDDKIMMVREMLDGGRWTLPGGWADPGESPSDSTVREVREESGYETRALKLLALYDRNKHPHPPHIFHVYKLFFRCEILGGAPTTSYETGGVDFFGEDEIPAELSIGRVTPAQIARFFEHLRNPDLPTDFD